MKTVLGIISALFIVASPWVLYWTLSHRQVAVAAIALVFAVLGWVSNNGTWLLILPSATQATFGLAFLRSLKGTPLIEHFARIVKPELSVPEQAHCRSWTKVWGIY